jgi:hypothetical protein
LSSSAQEKDPIWKQWRTEKNHCSPENWTQVRPARCLLSIPTELPLAPPQPPVDKSTKYNSRIM